MEQSSASTNSQSVFDHINRWTRTSIMLKAGVIGFLVLLLLIPTGMLRSLISEREMTRNAAIAEVSSKWGNEQVIGGPVLSVPYEIAVKDSKGQNQIQTTYLHFLPDQLMFDGDVRPEKRNRGIYTVMLYNTQLTIRGTFKKPSLTSMGLPAGTAQWDKAFLSLGISDMKGIRNSIAFTVNGRQLPAESGIPTNDIVSSGVSAPVQLDAATYRFESKLNLNGSSQLSFLPFGKETQVNLRSSWSTPSFTGSHLPDKRTVSTQGFQASWNVLEFNRNFPQQGIGNFLNKSNVKVADNVPLFGVKLLVPIDEYQKTTRSAKYGILFIFLTFVSFFFIEILDRRRIHPMQYLLVGFAICLFYVLLLSISEHISFDWAYLISSGVILTLVTFYVRYVFRNLRLTILFSAILTLLYGFFYSLLQLEDYSLLLGSAGLLLILATTMYLTRHVDWYRAYDPERAIA
ncbi:cell envelope integrity protein CreD [Spirosoma sp. RP8]|uniref:Cell envelope integrity protein CreD n=1 Tax=Spirosoma liriopis TaxID=2937440 RepID=A0ABT0HDW9_9BACT|nr:cell envelope integrity protein CreD [Spirosoma liriopis]MCK8490364.1 cell envelope integrity protein CreD [Spirosoma liriopis]